MLSKERAWLSRTLKVERTKTQTKRCVCFTIEVKTREAKEPIMIATDLGFEENCKRVVEEVVNAFGRIDVLVNCAAEQHEVSIEEIDEARLGRVFRTNIFSQFFLAK